MLEKGLARARATPSGTWLVIIVLAFLVIVGIGQTVSQWDRVTASWSSALGAALGVFVPLGALAWGVRRAMRGADRVKARTAAIAEAAHAD